MAGETIGEDIRNKAHTKKRAEAESKTDVMIDAMIDAMIDVVEMIRGQTKLKNRTLNIRSRVIPSKLVLPNLNHSSLPR